MTDIAAKEPLDRPCVLLAGEVEARPEGLERALTRAGFRVSEGPCRASGAPADAVLLTTHAADEAAIGALLTPCDETPPRVVLFAKADPDLPGIALALGAEDAAAAPVHLPEVVARIHARIRDRQAPTRTPYEREVRGALQALLAEARTVLQPEEIVLALVRRVARAFNLAGCTFVGTDPGAGQGEVVARVGASEGPERLDLGRCPEIVEALRTGRPVPLPEQGVALPVATEDGTTGVLLMQQRQGSAALGPTQLGLAAGLAEAAARALEVLPTQPRTGLTAPAESLTLDRRLHEEFERARRYSLSFSLVLLAIEALDGAGDRLAGELRRVLRLPDFVSRYGDTEFAIVLPETDAEGARRSVSRLRDRLAALSPGSLSAGIVSYPHPAVTQPDDLFALVEAALARGKAVGGRVGVAE